MRNEVVMEPLRFTSEDEDDDYEPLNWLTRIIFVLFLIFMAVGYIAILTLTIKVIKWAWGG